MKTIYLVRHGKAVKRDGSQPDFQRALVKKGKVESSDMAKKIKKAGICPDLLVSSSADRALETAHIFAERLGYPKKKILIKDSLYNVGTIDSLLAVIQDLDDTYHSVMLFGHEPAFSSLAASLLKDFDEPLPKSGVVSISYRRKTWKGVTPGNGRLKHFDFPRQISKAYKNTEKEMSDELSRIVESFFKGIHRQSAEKIQKTVKNSTRTLAEEFVNIMKSFKIKESQLKGFRKAKTSKKQEAPLNPPPEEETPDSGTRAADKPSQKTSAPSSGGKKPRTK